ncbi:hypothetical protein niasHT_024707 [Heterodera trifolii]|uniref:Uncharacterized protein n=1 Tax=Heterodera trifolii TaxID=157864 RepID=A0ABD2JDP0_9BILA
MLFEELAGANVFSSVMVNAIMSSDPLGYMLICHWQPVRRPRRQANEMELEMYTGRTMPLRAAETGKFGTDRIGGCCTTLSQTMQKRRI